MTTMAVQISIIVNPLDFRRRARERIGITRGNPASATHYRSGTNHSVPLDVGAAYVDCWNPSTRYVTSSVAVSVVMPLVSVVATENVTTEEPLKLVPVGEAEFTPA